MRLITALALCLLGSQASAQDGSVPVQQFAPAPGGDNNYVNVQGSGIMPHLKPSAGIYLNYAHDPLILRRVVTNEQVSLLEHHMQMDLVAALGIADFFEIGLAIPLTLYQAQGDNSDTLRPAAVDAFTMGDIRLVPKFKLYGEEEGFGLAIAVPTTLPTGSPANLQGNASVTLEPRLILQYIFSENFRLGLNAGFIWRPEAQELFNISIGNEVTAGLGLEYKFDKIDAGTFAIIAESWGKVSIESDTQAEERPFEVALAGRWWPEDHHAVTLGVSRGLTQGYGSPDFRVFAGYTYTPIGDDDPDGDGLKGEEDQCPNDPEDFDAFEDEDGCPDRDNDRDGIPDSRDKCPNEPEDIDGFEDADGCPEPDNDGDGICDPWVAERGVEAKYESTCKGSDQCPNDPEDFDGFQDEDGCPEADNDGDGLCDPWVAEKGMEGKFSGVCKSTDQCPLEPEDRDSWQDEDGCPDPDNDGDGILDVDDKCPDDPKDACAAPIIGRCEIQITTPVFFKYDKDEIDVLKSAPILDAVAEVLLKQDWIKLVEVQGHTDSDGPDDYNVDLSQRRSEQVRKYLIDKGVAAERLVAKGYGESKPIDTNRTPAGRAKNRRVQFMILDPSQDSCKQ
jgi:outer membrane protein OmpA-like peptidoglycan-associated protein